jgi:hypothetical protein
MSWNFGFYGNLTTVTAPLHEDLCTCVGSLNSAWNEKHLTENQRKSKHTVRQSV